MYSCIYFYVPWAEKSSLFSSGSKYVAYDKTLTELSFKIEMDLLAQVTEEPKVITLQLTSSRA